MLNVTTPFFTILVLECLFMHINPRFLAFAAVVCLVAASTHSTTVLAQDKMPASPPATVTATFDSVTATINYSQPSKKGREIFGNVVPFGEVWRTGANAATTFTLSKDAQFGGKAVKAGTYALFTIPGKDKWTVILNSDSKQMGAFNYKQAKDVLRVEVPSVASKEAVEKFTIMLPKADNGVGLTMAWDMTTVSVPLTK
jgi:hypothetical protein